MIGIGNPLRGDDGAGRAVARLLAERPVPSLARYAIPSPVVRESSGEATSLMEAWAGFDDVVLVDACRGAGPPGSVHAFEADEVDRIASLRHASSHSLGVAAAIGLARALGTLPARLVVYGVEARDTAEGNGLSPEVDAAIRRLADRLSVDSGRVSSGPLPEAGLEKRDGSLGVQAGRQREASVVEQVPDVGGPALKLDDGRGVAQVLGSSPPVAHARQWVPPCSRSRPINDLPPPPPPLSPTRRALVRRAPRCDRSGRGMCATAVIESPR